jgi:hypothetical protein
MIRDMVQPGGRVCLAASVPTMPGGGRGGLGMDDVVAVGVPPKIFLKPKGITIFANCVMRV